MTQKEENIIRSASKFLRIIYAEDINICANILNAEANILSNNKLNESISTLIKGLDTVCSWCKLLNSKLNELKHKSEI